ncbi:MAG TPA: hypothetical protein VHJ20_20680 [Polyangia bacterium]|nr:hypothetical protein [Polyangia bacterium]
MKSRALARAAAALGLGIIVGAAAVGCGLISSDVTAVHYPLPTKTYTFDTASWGVPAGNTTKINCGSADNVLTMTVMDCCNPPTPIPKPTCAPPKTTFACEANVCTYKQLVSIVSTVNLKDVQQLQSATSIANISLDDLDYNVTMNTLNTAVPPLTLYLAPMGVTDPSDAQAKKFGTVPSIPAGQLKMDAVALEPDSDTTFASFASNLAAPFNIIIATTASVPSGSPTPQGSLTVVVTGQFKAKLSL